MDNTVKSLKREVCLLRDRLTQAELKLVEAQRAELQEGVGKATPFTPRKSWTVAEIRPAPWTSGKRGYGKWLRRWWMGRRGS